MIKHIPMHYASAQIYHCLAVCFYWIQPMQIPFLGVTFYTNYINFFYELLGWK